MKNFEQSHTDHINFIYNDPCLEDDHDIYDFYADYERDEDDNLISPCCGEILDEDNMICPNPECREHC